MNMTIENLELIRISIGAQIQAALSIVRAAHFNPEPKTENHIAVINARWSAIEAIIYGEEDRLLKLELGRDPETLMRMQLGAARSALADAAETFEFYEKSHLQKGTSEGAKKAESNRLKAVPMRERIIKINALIGAPE